MRAVPMLQGRREYGPHEIDETGQCVACGLASLTDCPLYPPKDRDVQVMAEAGCLDFARGRWFQNGFDNAGEAFVAMGLARPWGTGGEVAAWSDADARACRYLTAAWSDAAYWGRA